MQIYKIAIYKLISHFLVKNKVSEIMISINFFQILLFLLSYFGGLCTDFYFCPSALPVFHCIGCVMLVFNQYVRRCLRLLHISTVSVSGGHLLMDGFPGYDIIHCSFDSTVPYIDLGVSMVCDQLRLY